jgi:hypothetical protein
MESRFDFVTIVNAVCVAGYVAFMLEYVALYDFGLSREVVSSAAMIAAIPIAALVAVDLFKKRGNVKWMARRRFDDAIVLPVTA